MTFSKSAWKRILVNLCACTKKSYTDIQIRNKFNQLKQRQNDFKLLLQETRIGYNATTGQVTTSEDVWKKLIRVKINNLYFFLIELSVVIVISILLKCRFISLLKDSRRKAAYFMRSYVQYMEILYPLVQMPIPRQMIRLTIKNKIVSNPKARIGNMVVWMKMMTTIKNFLVVLRNI